MQPVGASTAEMGTVMSIEVKLLSLHFRRAQCILSIVF